MKTTLKTMLTTFMTFLDDQGLPMHLDQNALMLVVPPAMYYATLEAINATIISNTTNVLNGVAGVHPWPYLTDTDTFYLIKTDGVVRPLIFQDREPIEFNSLAEGSEEDFKREKFLYGVRARYRMTYGYWQYAIRHVFTTT